jgi:hypothetical protein
VTVAHNASISAARHSSVRGKLGAHTPRQQLKWLCLVIINEHEASDYGLLGNMTIDRGLRVTESTDHEAGNIVGESASRTSVSFRAPHGNF